LAMGAANRGAAKRQTISVRIVQRWSVKVRSVFIVKSMVVGIPNRWTIKEEEGH
jgi:hypothetical protein